MKTTADKSPLRVVLLVASVVVSLSLGSASSGLSGEDKPMASKKIKNPEEPVREVIHGVVVEDPFRWLEDGDAARVREWARRQDLHTRNILHGLPWYEQLKQRLLQLHRLAAIGTPTPRGQRAFVLERSPEQIQYVLAVYELRSGQRTVLVDPNKLAADGTVAIDWFHVSPDGELVAYGLSEGGSERSTLHIVRADGSKLDDVIPATRACSLAWLPDASGFFYTRYPLPGTVPAGDENYYRRVYFHRLGTDPKADPLVFGADRAREDWPVVDLSPDGRWLVITVHQGWARSELYVADVSQEPYVFRPVAEGIDAIFDGIALNDRILIHTNWQAARYRVLIVNPRQPDLAKATEFVPEQQDTLLDVAVAGDRLLLTYLHNAVSRLVVTPLAEYRPSPVALPSMTTIAGIGATRGSRDAFVRIHSFVRPTELYRLGPEEQKLVLWRKVQAPIDPEQYEVKQVWYRSKDGTRVPMFLVFRRDLKPNSPMPTVLYGYGGFNISITPRFWPSLPVWLDSGGLLAVANLRGGAEFGEAWHRAGMLQNKQNVFDDFIAAAEWLIEQGYTSPERLAIMGRSNGGLLVAAALTQRPELFRAVICGVPLTDMVRYHKFLIARLWIPEYGDPDDPQHFRWLYAYSPYHRVRRGVSYPAVLITTAEFDTRVDPAHARKFAARLQNATAAEDRPILLRVESRAGHGAGRPVTKVVDEEADVWSFLFWQLGIEPALP